MICSVTKTNGTICIREATVLTEERGLVCFPHYRAYRANNLVKAVKRTCRVRDCDDVIRRNGLCNKHSQQERTYGEIPERLITTPNDISVDGDVAEMSLYDNACSLVGKTIFDTCLLEEVEKHKWRVGGGYVSTKVRGKACFLHHLVAGKPPKGVRTDHTNRDTLDNRRENLRFVTSSQNCMNRTVRSDSTSGITGVYWKPAIGKWVAQITASGKTMHLGYYKDRGDAIRARREGERMHFGDYTPDNQNTAVEES